MQTKPYYIYVLLCADQTLYCGFTDNVERRFKTHQTYRGAKYTRVKSRHPLKLIYQERFDDKRSALSAEYHFKHQTRQHKLAYLRQHGVNIQEL
ncbi:GIY-YIG catalytic domain protein [Limosilactobacillus coleohominis 101-4-CHN]|uniref:GIY-YIG catalytic domain protein n=1 Tax=Limosilactobacillus coleohominis 101-4-CHN TaxID=575594 RepID=C7XTR5_9LACO|nr:GIY-YIG nuclease family protein [Limosilactobacillus coleohominis]EEU30676.1 GIY-YIG catalytic domain protein [Limosilactobacillus coleohominis 101-4-CHN]